MSRITIIGGGNIGTLMAAEFSSGGHEVKIYTSKPQEFSQYVEIYTADDEFLFRGHLKGVTDDLGEAVKDAEIILITHPAFMFDELAEQIESLVRPEQLVGIVPGYGGAEFAFHRIVMKGCSLFALQRTHSIARIKEYGKSVYMLGRKDKIFASAVPSGKTHEVCEILKNLFGMPCDEIPHFLNITLTPSNSILHTARLFSMFEDYEKGKIYDTNPFFYETWDNKSSEALIACDDELMRLVKSIPADLSFVRSLKEHYESPDAEAMTRKISTIPAFKGILSPMRKEEQGWTPDFTSRYFRADFSYGLKLIIDIASVYGVETPNMLKVWNWYKKADPECTEIDFKAKYNLTADMAQRFYT